MAGKVEWIDVSKLFVEDQKYRLKIGVEDLARSIQEAGQINPITAVRAGSEYRVIAGRRRYAALTHIQEEITPNQLVKAMVYVAELSDLEQELVKIDENIMREQLEGVEYDEAIYRRKQIYEELHPETRQGSAGAHAKHAKATGKKKPAPAFAKDAAKKLGTSKKTVERAVARASRASDQVKAAREKGKLSPSKVDLLVTLPAADQDLLLSIAAKKDFKELRSVVESARKKGAKAVVLDLMGSREEDPRLKPVVRAAEKLSADIQQALEKRLTLEGDAKHESIRTLVDLARRIERFVSFQKAGLGYVQAISNKGGTKKVIRGRP